MLQDVDDIVQRVGVLMDDPSNSTFTREYIIPFIDQEYDEMDVELEQAGMQYIESIAVIPLAPLQADLSQYLADGQPLAMMKFPKYVKWKLTSQTDEFYQLSAMVDEIDEVNQANIGTWQWRNANGSIQITPSNIAITVKVYFDTISTNIYDPTQEVVRGTAHILAPRVGASICAVAGDQVKRGAWLSQKAFRNMNKFLTVLVQQKQQQNRSNPPIHGRRRGTGVVAGGNGYA